MPRRAAPPRLYLRKRANGAASWIILHRGRQFGTGALEHDRDKAHAALADYLGEKHRPEFGDGHPAHIRITDALSSYAEKHAPGLARPDLIGYAALRLGEFFGDRTVATLTETACADFVAWRCRQHDPRFTKSKARPIATATARRELVVLAAALRWCWRNGLLDRPVPIVLPNVAGARERHLTRSEAARLVAAALGFYREHGRWRRHHDRINRHVARFILLGLYTGTRHDAMLRLQWLRNTTGGYVDLEAGVLYLRPPAAVERSKRRPPLPIPPRLLPHLRRWRAHTARFLIEWRGLPIAHEYHAWHRARELAGLEADVTPHVLRHTCATWLLQAGVSVFDVAGVLGCSEAVVRDTYGRHAQDHLRAAVAMFSRARLG
jgi:integrase